MIDGLYPNDTWSGETVTYLRRRCQPGTLTVSLSSDPSLFLEPQTIVARSNGASSGGSGSAPTGAPCSSVPVAPSPGRASAASCTRSTPTAVPAEVTGGANPDDRELGAHFNRFVYEPAR